MSEKDVKVLILVRDVSKFKNAAQFLSRRGWSTQVAGNLKKALDIMTTHKATHVLISMNLQNPNVIKLPTLFTQTFQAKCIAIGEDGDNQTSTRLANCKVREIMYAPVSGPAIFMRIKKMIKEYNESLLSPSKDGEEAGEAKSEAASSKGSDVINIRGKKGEKVDDQTVAVEDEEVDASSTGEVYDAGQKKKRRSRGKDQDVAAEETDATVEENSAEEGSGQNHYGKKKKNVGQGLWAKLLMKASRQTVSLTKANQRS